MSEQPAEETRTKQTFPFKDRDAWIKALSASPNEKWLKKRSIGNNKNVTYMPIEVQQALGDIFFAEFDVIDADFKVIANEILCTVKISMLPNYPNAEHRTISGSGSKPIQCKSGSKAHEFPVGKITNSLEYCSPAARSVAISNAYTTVGNVFGRNISRKVSDGYNMLDRNRKSKDNG